MQKKHYWQYVIDDSGNPVVGATVNLYLTNSTTYAYYFASAASTSQLTTDATPITTDSYGYFHFYLADKSDPVTSTYGYNYYQRFKIVVTKAGDTLVNANDVEILDVQHYGVDETDTDAVKNKLVSNAQAKSWADHVVEELGVSGITEVHNIQAVDATDTDVVKNKVISNAQAKSWSDHVAATSGYLAKDGSTPLTSSWDMGDKAIGLTNLAGRDILGILVRDSVGNLIFTAANGLLQISVVDINGGAIDGATINGSDIGQDTAGLGTFTNLVANQLETDLIKTKSAGDLTITDRRGNVAITVVNSTGAASMDNVDINGGSIDGVNIGNSSPPNVKLTSLIIGGTNPVSEIVDVIIEADTTKLPNAAAIVDYTARMPIVEYDADVNDYLMEDFEIGLTISVSVSASGGKTITIPTASEDNMGALLRIFKLTAGDVYVARKSSDTFVYLDAGVTPTTSTQVSATGQYEKLDLQVVDVGVWAVINVTAGWSFS